MANIKLTLPGAPFTGQIVTFTAPCDCDRVTDGLLIGGQVYTIVDANGQCATGKGGRWVAGASVSVILNVEKKLAYIQNADTNEYLEGRFTDLENSLGARIDELAAAGGACKIETGYYIGASKNKTITFGFDPAFVYVSSAEDQHESYATNWVWVKGTDYMADNSGGNTATGVSVPEEGKSITILYNSKSPTKSQIKYNYVAIG